MNDLKTIRQLIKLMVDNDLSEIDLEGEGEKIKLKRGGAGGSPAPQVQYVPAPGSAPPPPPAGASPAAAPADPGDDDHSDDDLMTIDSPMVGTFYTASSPEAEAFTSVGQTIKPDSVVCIVEAMKVFNEIKAEVSGTIVEVLVETGQAVEFGQPMFKVRP
ncbi:MAG: acetyl-CoA carboxylase biotin carboxyl carrier protein [Planctomycetota bacterium]